jgi:hypothetical protein
VYSPNATTNGANESYRHAQVESLRVREEIAKSFIAKMRFQQILIDVSSNPSCIERVLWRDDVVKCTNIWTALEESGCATATRNQYYEKEPILTALGWRC